MTRPDDAAVPTSPTVDALTELTAARVEADQLREAMAGRAYIEQAKGILMAVHRIDGNAAFALLRERSQRSNTRLRDVAAAFVAAQAELLVTAANPPPGPVEGVHGTQRPSRDFEAAFVHAPIGMAVADEAGVLEMVNPALARLLGGTPEALEGSSLLDAVHPEDLGAAREAQLSMLARPERTAVLRLRLRDAAGDYVPATVSVAKVPGPDGSVTQLVLHVEDDTDHQDQAEVLRSLALHDPLTGLPNRALFTERLEHGWARHHRAAAPISLLFCDVDEFKSVNDTHGHPVGDTVMVALAQRLRAGVRPGDTAARLGGDEFVVLCEDADPTTAAAVAQRLTRSLGEPVEVGGVSVSVSVSIGWATSTPDQDVAALIRAADDAMYRVKRA